jgi:hypothetical protein
MVVARAKRQSRVHVRWPRGGELPGHLDGLPRYQVQPESVETSHDIVASPLVRDNLEQTVRSLLAHLEKTAKLVRTIHLFVAAPNCAAVVVGRTFDPQVHPNVRIYDRVGGAAGRGPAYVHVLDLPTPAAAHAKDAA